MADLGTINSYLVSLGFQIDQQAYNKFIGTLKQVSSVVEQQTASMSKAYIGAATAIVGALTTVTLATGGLLDKLGSADMEYQKFGKRMFMTTESAKRLKIATDALGESVLDISHNLELKGRYDALIELQKRIGEPAGYAGQMKHIRDIAFEFTKLKVILLKGSEGVGSNLMNMLNVGGLESFMQRLNKWLEDNMKDWTRNVAEFLTVIINYGESAGKALGKLAEYLMKVYKTLGPTEKAFLSWGAVISAFFIMGPFGKALIVIGALVAGIEDFYAWLEGRKSNAIMAPIWEAMLSLFHALKDAFSGLLDAMKEMFGTQTRWESLADVFSDLGASLSLIGAVLALVVRHVTAIVKIVPKLFSGTNLSMEQASMGMQDLNQEGLKKVVEESQESLKEGLDKAVVEMGRLLSMTPAQRRAEWAAKAKEREAAAPPGGVSPAAGGNTPLSGRAKYAMSYFISQGASPEDAAGLVGTLQDESGQNLDKMYEVRKDGSRGPGINVAQWTDPKRKADFRAYAKSREKPEDDWQVGLEYAWIESRQMPRLMEALKKAKTPEEYAAAYDKHFEAPQYSHAVSSGRNAQRLYQDYQSSPASKGFQIQPAIGPTSSLNVGDIHINVTNPNASADDIKIALREELTTMQKRSLVAANRHYGGGWNAA